MRHRLLRRTRVDTSLATNQVVCLQDDFYRGKSRCNLRFDTSIIKQLSFLLSLQVAGAELFGGKLKELRLLSSTLILITPYTLTEYVATRFELYYVGRVGEIYKACGIHPHSCEPFAMYDAFAMYACLECFPFFY